MKKIIIVIIVVVVVLLAVLIVSFAIKAKGMNEKLDTIGIEEMDLSDKEDGFYVGSSDAGIISAKVRVEVEDGQVADIEIIRHFNGQGEPAEMIVYDIMEKQSLMVDTVPGATGSSKVILDAVQNALK